MYEVKKIAGGFAVIDWNGNIEIAYKNRKNAEQYANGAVHAVFNEAERYNDRLDIVRAYLAERSERVTKPVAQLELF